MSESQTSFRTLLREHPVFFWGMVTVLLLFLLATALVATRVPRYQREAAEIDRRMSEEEKATRDRILDSRARRSELAVGLLQRELRLKALQEKGLHLALSVEDSVLALRHGPATLRQARVTIGRDSMIQGPGGQSWRLVRPLGERTVAEKAVGMTYTVPEWVYVSRGQPVPTEDARRVEGGLGRYVLRLNDGTEIYSRPKTGPFTEGVKPAAFVVESEADLRAIFDAIGEDTPVFIY